MPCQLSTLVTDLLSSYQVFENGLRASPKYVPRACPKEFQKIKTDKPRWFIMQKKQIKSVVKKLKVGDGIEVEWVDASDDDGDLTNFTW